MLLLFERFSGPENELFRRVRTRGGEGLSPSVSGACKELVDVVRRLSLST